MHGCALDARGCPSRRGAISGTSITTPVNAARTAAVSTRFEMRGARVTPWLTGSLIAGRQRLGYEIDLRYRGTTRQFGGGVDVRVAGRTRVGLSAGRITYDHEPADFLGSNLREVLDRRSGSFGLQLRHALTPLTTLVVSGERARERFEFTPARNANSSRIDAGFDLSPFALIAGRGRVGYRRFTGTRRRLAALFRRGRLCRGELHHPRPHAHRGRRGAGRQLLIGTVLPVLRADRRDGHRDAPAHAAMGRQGTRWGRTASPIAPRSACRALAGSCRSIRRDGGRHRVSTLARHARWHRCRSGAPPVSGSAAHL